MKLQECRSIPTCVFKRIFRKNQISLIIKQKQLIYDFYGPVSKTVDIRPCEFNIKYSLMPIQETDYGTWVEQGGNPVQYRSPDFLKYRILPETQYPQPQPPY